MNLKNQFVYSFLVGLLCIVIYFIFENIGIAPVIIPDGSEMLFQLRSKSELAIFFICISGLTIFIASVIITAISEQKTKKGISIVVMFLVIGASFSYSVIKLNSTLPENKAFEIVEPCFSNRLTNMSIKDINSSYSLWDFTFNLTMNQKGVYYFKLFAGSGFKDVGFTSSNAPLPSPSYGEYFVEFMNTSYQEYLIDTDMFKLQLSGLATYKLFSIIPSSPTIIVQYFHAGDFYESRHTFNLTSLLCEVKI